MIIIAIIAAVLLSAFQYLYKRKALLLFALRSLMYFSVLLLLINPKFEKQISEIQKPKLYVLADNTSSIKAKNLDKEEVSLVERLKNAKLSDKFDLRFFIFDQMLHPLDSMDFKGDKTDIDKSLRNLNDIHFSEHSAPVVLLTDGISSIGNDYRYSLPQNTKLNLFPVLVGDTTQYRDVRIDLLNANSFAYKGNKFPVEIFASFSGKGKAESTLSILENGKTLFKRKLQFSQSHPSQKLETMLPATSKGNHHYVAVLSRLSDEKNRLNNRRYFSVNVIDNAQKVLIVSNTVHPDLGAIKRSLSQNKYLKVSWQKNTRNIPDIRSYTSLILYQPTADFANIFLQIKKEKTPWFIITGKHTDWRFLNAQKLFFSKEPSSSFESYYPLINDNFSLFKLPDLKLERFPPIQDRYGKIRLDKNASVALYAAIKGIKTEAPLLAFNSDKKQAVLFGQDIWRWRMKAGLTEQKQNFDLLLQQSIQYLSLQKDYNRIKLQYKSQYFQNDNIKITAQILNKNLQPDDKAAPSLYLRNAGNKEKYPMSNQGDFYQVDFSNLRPGTYSFTVMSRDKTLKKSGSFVVLPYNLENKNLRAQSGKLHQLAEQTSGQLYFSDQIDDLIRALQKDGKYPSINKLQIKKTPLIDYRYLLFFIVFLLAVEWFYKKLRGEL